MTVKELLGEYKDDEEIKEIFVQKPDGELDFFIHNYAAFDTGDIDDCLRKFGPRKVKDSSIFENEYDVPGDLEEAMAVEYEEAIYDENDHWINRNRKIVDINMEPMSILYILIH